MARFARVATLIIIAGVVGGLGWFMLQDSRYAATKHEPKSQLPTDRTWIERDLEYVQWEAPVYKHLFRPVQVKIHDGEMYISDFGDSMKVKRFSLDGQLLNTIGNGRGEGPGELQLAADFHVADGEVWVADSRARNVSRFTVDGTFLDRFDADFHPLRVTKSQGRVVLMRMGPAELFQIIDTTGTVARTFGDLVSNQTTNFMALNGNLVVGPEEDFIYVPKYASYLYYYSAEGELRNVVQTIDRRAFPSVQKDESGGGVRYQAPDPPVKTLSASVSDGILYLHTYFRQEDRESYQVLDRYDWASGAYLNSIRLPFQVPNLSVHGDNVYCMGDTTVYAFHFEE